MTTPSKQEKGHEGTEDTTPVSSKKSGTEFGPAITITPDDTDPSPDHTPKMNRHDTLSRSLRRNESIARKRSFSEKYELSPDLRDKSIKLLERKYGGKDKAHWAARVIQLYYRKHAMNQRFTRMRTFSDHTPKKSHAFSTKEEMSSTLKQGTAVDKFKGNNSVKIKRRSMLVIDNLASVPLSPLRTNFDSKLSSPQNSLQQQEVTEVSDAKNVEKMSQNESVSESQTEYYVKVEILENLETSPAVEMEQAVPEPHPSCILPDELGESDHSGKFEKDRNKRSLTGFPKVCVGWNKLL